MARPVWGQRRTKPRAPVAAGISMPHGLAVRGDPETHDAALLTPADFALLGYYDLQTNATNSFYAQGLTHRYVQGDFRLMIWQLGNRLEEISLTGHAYGDVILTATRSWSGMAGLFDFKAFWWDESRGLLWTTSCVDYTTGVLPTQIYSHVLNEDGTIGAEIGPISLEGISAKRVYGGLQAVPAWFQAQYGVGPCVCGWGGYTSLAGAGGIASFGPAMYAFDPEGHTSGETIPAGSFKVLMDHSPSINFCNATPHADRGRRLTWPLSYYEGGDPRANPSSRPPDLPLPGGCWQSPQADGFGRLTWGDSYYNTGCWIETPTKRGFILLMGGSIGAAYYANSSLQYDGRVSEMHIFDPAMLGDVALGRRDPCDTQPTAMWVFPQPGLNFHGVGNAPAGNAAGATYDPQTQRLYIAGYGGNSGGNATRIYVFAVDQGTPPRPMLHIVTPFAGQTVFGTITLLAASQGNLGGGVSLYLRSADRTLQQSVGPEVTSTPTMPLPYQANFDTTTLPNGAYEATAGSHVLQADWVPFTIINDNTVFIPPTLVVTNPTEGAVLRGQVVLTAVVTGDIGGGVTFWWKSADGSIQTALSGEVKAAPYQMPLNTTAFPNGPYVLTVITHRTPDVVVHLTVSN